MSPKPPDAPADEASADSERRARGPDDAATLAQRALRLSKAPPPELAARLASAGLERLLASPDEPRTERVVRTESPRPPEAPRSSPRPPPGPALSLRADDPLADADLTAVPFAVIDFETTGLHPAFAEIIELACVEVVGGRARFQDATLVRPEARLPPEITALTGIEPSMLTGAPPLREALLRLRACLEGHVLVAHHAPFDLGFLDAALAREGFERWAGPVLCTRKMARRLRPDLPKRSLDALAEAYGLRNAARHRARGDAEVTADLLVELLRQASSMGARTLADLALMLEAPAARAVDFSGFAFGPARLAHLPARPGIYRMRDRDGALLYVGKARNLRERVGSYFQGRARGRVQLLRERVYDFEVEETGSELEALLLESAEILAHRPPLNVQVNVRRRGFWLKLGARMATRFVAVNEPCEGALGPFVDGAGGREIAKRLRLAFDLVHGAPRRVDPAAFLARGEGVELLCDALEAALARVPFGAEPSRAETLRQALRTVRRIAAQRALPGDTHHRRDLLVRLPGHRAPRLFLLRDGRPLERFVLEDDGLAGLARRIRARLREPAPVASSEPFEAHLLLDAWLTRHAAAAVCDLGDLPPPRDGEPEPLEPRLATLLAGPAPGDVTVLT